MAAAASAGAARLRAAGAKATPAAGGSYSLRAVLEAEQRALDANLRALRNGDRRLRPLTTDLVVTGARHAAVLRGMLGDDPAPSALP